MTWIDEDGYEVYYEETITRSKAVARIELVFSKVLGASTFPNDLIGLGIPYEGGRVSVSHAYIQDQLISFFSKEYLLDMSNDLLAHLLSMLFVSTDPPYVVGWTVVDDEEK